MVCSWLTTLTVALGMTHTYFLDRSQPVALTVTDTNHRNITVVNSANHLYCFSSYFDSLRRLRPFEFYSESDNNAILYMKDYKIVPYEGCEDDEDDDDDDDDDHHHHTIHKNHKNPPTPIPFKPAKRNMLKSQLVKISRALTSGELPVKKIAQLSKQIREIKQKIAKENVKEVIQKQRNFAKSEDGKNAHEYCKSLGAKGNAYKGCMQDMRLTGNLKIVKKAVQVTKVAQRVLAKSTRNGVSRVCTASGDPHFTNFNGDYFHLQEPSIFVFAKSKDGMFEVQVKQDGATRVGQPSYVRAVKVRYGNNVYTSNFNQDGLIVKQDGTTLTVTVPPNYENEMTGVCGEDTPNKGAHNFKLPNGDLADVDYGKSGWEMGGYGGPNTKLSKWHLSWKPTLDTCLFTLNECKSNLGLSVLTKTKRRG